MISTIASLLLISFGAVGLFLIWLYPKRAEHRRIGAFYRAYRKRR